MTQVEPKHIKPKFQWSLNWRVCLFAAALFPVLVALGFWQLDRAEQKVTLQQTLEQEQARPPVSILTYQKHQADSEFVYRPVFARGKFLTSNYWLLENKVFNGQVGFEVVMPLRLLNNDVVLVNRGWVAGTGYRDQLPSINTPEGEVTVTGWMVLPSQNRLLKNAVVESAQWPKLILNIDSQAQALQLGEPLLPHVLQVAPESTGALVTNWQPINTTPQKHHGYAVQWFGMAAALLILTVLANSNFAQWIKGTHD